MTTTLTAPPPIAERAKKLPDGKKPKIQPTAAIRKYPTPARPEPYKFDVYQYRAMAEAGILGQDDRVELIDGEIAAMSAIGPEHKGAVNFSAEFWVLALAGEATVQIQGSVRLDDRNMPEPDVAILKRRNDFYASRHAGPDDVLLIIEVSDATLRYDRQTKLALYARFGIPEVWIANIRARAIEAYTDPENGEYATRRTFRAGQTVSPAAFPDIALPVADIIGEDAPEG